MTRKLNAQAIVGTPPSTSKGKKGDAGTKKQAQEETALEQTPPKPTKVEFDAYYDSGKGCFWTRNGKGQWQRFGTDELGCMLKNRGFFAVKREGYAATEVDEFLHRIRFNQTIDWAGELAGWQTGIHTISGMDVLITRGSSPVVPKSGKFPHIAAFLKTLLSREQLPYFLGWLRGSLESLRDGFPFRPGQLVAFCGSVNCGKSFVQMLITHILGGRMGDPTEFLLGNTNFNSDFLRAEHLGIEDKALKDFSHGKRRNFAANLKTMVVNSEQRVRGMFKEAVLLPVATRLSLSCNDAPEALAILPALDSDVADKVIYFLCGEGVLPMRTNSRMSRGEQLAIFLAELPAFVHMLNSYRIPERIKDPGNRFTVAAYHHPKIIERLQNLTPEQRLLNLLEILPLKWPADGIFEGTASEVEQWMRADDEHRMLDRILSYAASMGYLLAKIAKDGEERIQVLEGKSRKNRYRINREEL